MPFDSEVNAVSRVALVLQRARDKIKRRWCQDDFYDEGAYCIVGAINSAYKSVEGQFPAGTIDQINSRVLKPFLDELGFDGASEAIEFNDHENDEGLRAHKKAILRRFDKALDNLK